MLGVTVTLIHLDGANAATLDERLYHFKNSRCSAGMRVVHPEVARAELSLRMQAALAAKLLGKCDFTLAAV